MIRLQGHLTIFITGRSERLKGRVDSASGSQMLSNSSEIQDDDMNERLVSSVLVNGTQSFGELKMKSGR